MQTVQKAPKFEPRQRRFFFQFFFFFHLKKILFIIVYYRNIVLNYQYRLLSRYYRDIGRFTTNQDSAGKRLLK